MSVLKATPVGAPVRTGLGVLASTFSSTGTGPAIWFGGTAYEDFGVCVISTGSTQSTVVIIPTMAAATSDPNFFGSTSQAPIGQVLVSSSTVAGSTGNSNGDVVWFTGKPCMGLQVTLSSASSSGGTVVLIAVPR